MHENDNNNNITDNINEGDKSNNNNEDKTPKKKVGRPKGQKDFGPRKKRTDKPRLLPKKKPGRQLGSKNKKPVGRPKTVEPPKPVGRPKKEGLTKARRGVGRPKGSTKALPINTIKDLENITIQDGILMDLTEFFDKDMFKGMPDLKFKKELFLKALVYNYGNLTKTCAELKIRTSSIYDWKKGDEHFNNCYNEVENIVTDFVESKLMKMINIDDKQTIMFYLKTKGKDRGYTERTEQNVTHQIPININIMLEDDEDDIDDITIIE